MARIPKKLVKAIMERDGEQCQYCSRPASDLHHIIAAGQGGRKVHRKENLISLCRDCHSKAHGYKEMKEWCIDWSRKKYGKEIDDILRKKKFPKG